MAADEPRFRISAVAEMTGVPAPTLRAWEARYGVPAPTRGESSSYRLYREQDVDLVRRLKGYCDAGMAPGEAADLVLREAREGLAPVPAPRLPGELRLADEIVAAAHAFDPHRLDEAVRRALLMGSGRRIFEDVFRPALRRIGDDWHDGRISVAQEHLASERLDTATRLLLRLVQVEVARRSVLLVLYGDEQHLLPLYGAAFHFAEWGFRVTMLGRSMPPEAVAHAVVSLAPDLVGFSLTTPPKHWQVPSLVRAYAGACGSTPWLVGGGAAPSIAAEVRVAGGAVAAESMAETRELVERLLKRNGGP